MDPSISVPLFLVKYPVIVAALHSTRTVPLVLVKLDTVFSRRWARMHTVFLTPVHSPVSGLSLVFIGSVISGEAEAVAGRANAASATRAKKAVMSFLFMRYFLSLMPGIRVLIEPSGRLPARRASRGLFLLPSRWTVRADLYP